MEAAVTEMHFRMDACDRCGRRTVHALRTSSASLGAGEHGICAVCEPGAFERAALGAGRREFLR